MTHSVRGQYKLSSFDLLDVIARRYTATNTNFTSKSSLTEDSMPFKVSYLEQVYLCVIDFRQILKNDLLIIIVVHNVYRGSVWVGLWVHVIHVVSVAYILR